jgi:hypothetical protein
MDRLYMEVRAMTISPIGPFPPQPSNSDDTRNASGNQSAQGSPEGSRTDSVNASDHVEISNEARDIRARQAEISHLQAAERAAEVIEDKVRQADAEIKDLREARQVQDAQREKQAIERLNKHLQEVKEEIRNRRYQDNPILDGSTFKSRVNEVEKQVKFPDANDEFDRFHKEVRKIVDEHKKPESTHFADRLREFRSRSREVRTTLENDVRERVAGNVRESSRNQPRDIKEAEKLIQKAREQAPRESTNNADRLSSRAVNLLK